MNYFLYFIALALFILVFNTSFMVAKLRGIEDLLLSIEKSCHDIKERKNELSNGSN